MQPANPSTDAPVLRGFRLTNDREANPNRETATSFDILHPSKPAGTPLLNPVENPLLNQVRNLPENPRLNQGSKPQSPFLTVIQNSTQGPGKEQIALPNLKKFRLADLNDPRGPAISFAAEEIATGLPSTGRSVQPESSKEPGGSTSTGSPARARTRTDVESPVRIGFRLAPEAGTSREAAVSFFGVVAHNGTIGSARPTTTTLPIPFPPPESPSENHPPEAKEDVGSPFLRGFRLPNERRSLDPPSHDTAVSFDATHLSGGSLHQPFGGGSPHRSLLRPVTEEPAEVGLSIVLTADGPRTPNPRSASFAGSKTSNPGSVSPGERSVLRQGDGHGGLPRGRLTWNNVINGASLEDDRDTGEARPPGSAVPDRVGRPSSELSTEDNQKDAESEVRTCDVSAVRTDDVGSGSGRSDVVSEVRTDDVSDEVCKRVVVEEGDVGENMRSDVSKKMKRGARKFETRSEEKALEASQRGVGIERVPLGKEIDDVRLTGGRGVRDLREGEGVQRKGPKERNESSGTEQENESGSSGGETSGVGLEETQTRGGRDKRRGSGNAEWPGTEGSETETVPVSRSGTGKREGKLVGKKGSRAKAERAQVGSVEQGKKAEERLGGKGFRREDTEQDAMERSGKAAERIGSGAERKGVLEQEWTDSHEDVSEPVISAARAFSPRQKPTFAGSSFEDDVILGSPSNADVAVSRLPSSARMPSFSGRDGSAAESAAKAFGQKGAFQRGGKGRESRGEGRKNSEFLFGGKVPVRSSAGVAPEAEAEVEAQAEAELKTEPETGTGTGTCGMKRGERTETEAEAEAVTEKKTEREAGLGPGPERYKKADVERKAEGVLRLRADRSPSGREPTAVTSLEMRDDVSGGGSGGSPPTRRKPVSETLRRKLMEDGKRKDGKRLDKGLEKGNRRITSEETDFLMDGKLENVQEVFREGKCAETAVDTPKALSGADVGGERPTKGANPPKTRPGALGKAFNPQRPSDFTRLHKSGEELLTESPAGDHRGSESFDGLTLLATQYENSPSPVAPRKAKAANTSRGNLFKPQKVGDFIDETPSSGATADRLPDRVPVRAGIQPEAEAEPELEPEPAPKQSVQTERPQETTFDAEAKTVTASKTPEAVKCPRKPAWKPRTQPLNPADPPGGSSAGHSEPEAKNQSTHADPRPNPTPVRVTRPESAGQPTPVSQSPEASSPPHPQVSVVQKLTGPKASDGSKLLKTPEPSDSPRVALKARAKPRHATSANAATSSTAATSASAPECSGDSPGRSDDLPTDSYLLSEPYRPGDSNRPGSSGRPLTAERPGSAETAGRFTYSERPMSAERWVAPETPNPPANPSLNPPLNLSGTSVRDSRSEGLPFFPFPIPGLPPQTSYAAASHWPVPGGQGNEPGMVHLHATSSPNPNGYPPFLDPHQQMLAQYMQQPGSSLPPGSASLPRGLAPPYANPFPNPHPNPESAAPVPLPFWPPPNPLVFSQEFPNHSGQSQLPPNLNPLNSYSSYPNPAVPFSPYSNPYFGCGFRPNFYPPLQFPFAPTPTSQSFSHVPNLSAAQGGGIPAEFAPLSERSTSVRSELLKAREIAVQRAQLRASRQGGPSPTAEKSPPATANSSSVSGDGLRTSAPSRPRSAQPGSAQPRSAQAGHEQLGSSRPEYARQDSGRADSAQGDPSQPSSGQRNSAQPRSAQRTPIPRGNDSAPGKRTSVNNQTLQQTGVNRNRKNFTRDGGSSGLGRLQKSTPSPISQSAAPAANPGREPLARSETRPNPLPNSPWFSGLTPPMTPNHHPPFQPLETPQAAQTPVSGCAFFPASNLAPNPAFNPAFNPALNPVLHSGDPLPSYDDFLDFLRFRSALAARASAGLTSPADLAQAVLTSARDVAPDRMTSAHRAAPGMLTSAGFGRQPQEGRAHGALPSANGVLPSAMTYGGVPVPPVPFPGGYHDEMLTSAKEVQGRAATLVMQRRRDSAARVIQTLWHEHKLCKRERRRREAPERRAGMLLTWKCRARFLHVRRVTIRLQSLRRGCVARRGFYTVLWAIRTVQTAWKLFRASLSNWQRGKLRELRDLYRHVELEGLSFRRFAALMERLVAVAEGAKVRRRLRAVKVKALVSEMRDIRDLLHQLEGDKMKGRGTPDRQLEKALQVQLYQKHRLLERAVHTPLRARSSSTVKTPLPSPHPNETGSLFGREQRGFGQQVPGGFGQYPGDPGYGRRSDGGELRRGLGASERQPGASERYSREVGRGPGNDRSGSMKDDPYNGASLRDQPGSIPVARGTGQRLGESGRGTGSDSRVPGSLGHDRNVTEALRTWASESGVNDPGGEYTHQRSAGRLDVRRQVSYTRDGGAGILHQSALDENQVPTPASLGDNRTRLSNHGGEYSHQQGTGHVSAQDRTPRVAQAAERKRISFRGASIGFGNVPPAANDAKGTGQREAGRHEMRSPGTSFTEQFEGPVFRTYESGFSLSPVGESYPEEGEESQPGDEERRSSNMVNGLVNDDGFVEFEDIPYDAESDSAPYENGLGHNLAKPNSRDSDGAYEHRSKSEAYSRGSHDQAGRETRHETRLRDGLSPNPSMQPNHRVSYDDIPITTSSTPRYLPNLAIDLSGQAEPPSENSSPSEKSGRGAVKRPFLRARSGRLGTSFTIPDHFKLAIPELTRGSSGPALDSAELGPSTAPGNFGRSIFSSGRRVRGRVKRNELESEISILEREDEGEDEVPTKRAFLQRKSKAMPMQKLDWSNVKPLVEARLNPEKMGSSNRAGGAKKEDPPPLPDYKNVKSRLLAYREPNKKQPSSIEEDPSFEDGDQPPVLRLPKSPRKRLGKTTPQNRKQSKQSESEDSFGAQSDGERIRHVPSRDRPRNKTRNRRGLGVSERREAWGVAGDSEGELADVSKSMTSQNRREKQQKMPAGKAAGSAVGSRRGGAGRVDEVGGLADLTAGGATREREENECQVSLSPTGDLLERLYRKLRYDRGLEFSSLFPRRGGGGESVIPRLRSDADVFGDQGSRLLKRLTREGRFDNLDMGLLTFVAATGGLGRD